MKNRLNLLLLLPLSLLALPLPSPKSEELKIHALYLMQKHQVSESLQRYQEYTHLSGKQDFETLQQMGGLLLAHGAQSNDPQIFLMTLFGAGISGSSEVLGILEAGLRNPDPNIQGIALHFIGQSEEDKAWELLQVAMSSDYLSTRMEAAFYMAAKKHPLAMGHIEGLLFRLPPMFKPYFPSLFALLGTKDATAALRRLVEDADVQVRVESILNIAKMGRDDFLPLLRKRLSYCHIAELEAAAFAIGTLRDSSSLPKLKKLAASSVESVRLSASLALFRLGERSYASDVKELARRGNPFAVFALGEIEGAEDLLYSLMRSDDLRLRINATAALLQRRDPRALQGLSEILIQDARNLAFSPFPSLGRSLLSLRAIPSAHLREEDPTVNLGLSLALRDHFLREATHLPEVNFLTVARLVFQKQQNDLVPTLIALLENLRTPGAIELLKEGTQTLASPLIRNYCHLALYRLEEEGPYEEHVNHWIQHQKNEDLIRLRPLLPWKLRLEQPDYTLTPEETSQLLIESFLAIANRRDEKSIHFLLDALQNAHPANRYALMGLLMKATE
ncbi:MAG: HEAT repeat domain-containing protein [Verrucomicrobiota bacterium]|nr:HEAT repeat domain-containing protein [Verrucomicrobiota bacterium]